MTTFLDAHGPLRPGATSGILGALLGRLHARAADGLRAGGAWHHLSFTGGPREEIAAASALVEAYATSVGDAESGLVSRLRDEVARTDDCQDLPHAFVHPDFVAANAITTAGGRLAMVDWAGAGRGPRLWSIGFLLWAAGARDPRLVNAVVSRYRRSTTLAPDELERLKGAIRGRPVMLEAWSVCAGRRRLPQALAQISEINELAGSIAARARQAYAAPGAA